MYFQSLSFPDQKQKIRNNPISYSFKKTILNKKVTEIYVGLFQISIVVEGGMRL